MKVVSFSIFKGGTGKTTSAVNTAAALVQKGAALRKPKLWRVDCAHAHSLI